MRVRNECLIFLPIPYVFGLSLYKDISKHTILYKINDIRASTKIHDALKACKNQRTESPDFAWIDSRGPALASKPAFAFYR